MFTSSSIQFPRSTFLRRILGALGTEVKPGPLGPMEQRWYGLEDLGALGDMPYD